jgi:DNA ligase-1
MLLADVVATSEAVASTRSRTAKIDALATLLARSTADEIATIVGFLVGQPRQGRIGIGWATLAAVRDSAVSDANGEPLTVADVDTAISTLPALEEIALVVLRPVLPMLAASAPNVEEALRQTGLASVEWKLDGARIQVHRRGEDVRIYTRNLNDITERLPEVVRVALEFPSEAFVLDGEAIGVDDDAKPHVFQDTMSRFGRDDASSHAMTMSAFFFDVLHADGEDVLDRPLRDRAHVLRRIVGDLRVPAIETDDAALAAAFLEQALTTGHEGVMVKALDSTYDAGRRGGSWRKVKPVRTLDLVVLAAEWGHGRRRGWLSNLHLGARDPETGDFVMVGKTFKGLTDELLTWQTERLQEIADREEGITVYVRPELVVEIALDGVQASTRYAGGVALRFARVRAYRPDKSPEDADTIATVRALRAGAQ